jgi:hypothetical protein
MVNIGFISTRFAGQDEVSLVSANLAAVLRAAGKRVSFLCCGLFNRHPDIFHFVPYAYFTFTDNEWINRCICNWVPFDARLVGKSPRGLVPSSECTTCFLKSIIFYRVYSFVKRIPLSRANFQQSIR